MEDVEDDSLLPGPAVPGCITSTYTSNVDSGLSLRRKIVAYVRERERERQQHSIGKPASWP